MTVALVHKVRSIKTLFTRVGVEELGQLAQSPDLSPTKHRWDKLDHQLQGKNQC